MLTAANMFLRQVSLAGGILFRVDLPEAPRPIDVGSMSGGQLFETLLRGLQEVEEGGGVEASATFSRMRQELR